MKKIYFSVTIEVPDCETDVHWDGLLNAMEEHLLDRGYPIYDKEWSEVYESY